VGRVIGAPLFLFSTGEGFELCEVHKLGLCITPLRGFVKRKLKIILKYFQSSPLRGAGKIHKRDLKMQGSAP
jgi:hypothetical protein